MPPHAASCSALRDCPFSPSSSAAAPTKLKGELEEELEDELEELETLDEEEKEEVIPDCSVAAQLLRHSNNHGASAMAGGTVQRKRFTSSTPALNTHCTVFECVHVVCVVCHVYTCVFRKGLGRVKVRAMCGVQVI